MLERRTEDVVIDSDPKRQLGGQVNVMLGLIYGIDSNSHIPGFSKLNRFCVDFLTGMCVSLWDDPLRLRVPPTIKHNSLAERGTPRRGQVGH